MLAKLTSRAIFHGLSLLAVAILTLSALALWLPRDIAVASATDAPEAAPTALPLEASEAAIASLAAPVAERPIFDFTRRPPEKEMPEVAPAPEVVITLVGILDSELNRIALIRKSDAPEILRLRAGQSVGDFRVVAISKRGVRMRSEAGEELELSLDG